MNELQKVFNYSGVEVRTVVKDGEPWFVARDICDVLEITDQSQAVERLKENQRGRYSIPTPGGNQEMVFVSEAGLYKLIFTSRKTEAIAFQDWVCEEVLPAIRKTGHYEITQKCNQLSRQLKNTIDQKLYNVITDETKTIEQADAEVCRIIDSIKHSAFFKIISFPHLKINKLANFIDDLCELGEDYEIDLTPLYNTYAMWIMNQDQKPICKSKFANRLAEHDEIAYLKSDYRHGLNARFVGVRLGGLKCN